MTIADAADTSVQSGTWTLESIDQEWGSGPSRQGAIENAVAAGGRKLIDGTLHDVTHDTILEYLAYSAGNGGLDLWESR